MNPTKRSILSAAMLGLALAACAAKPEKAAHPVATSASASVASNPPELPSSRAEELGSDARVDAGAPLVAQKADAGRKDPLDLLVAERQLCLVVRRAGSTLLRYRKPGAILTIETGDVRGLTEGVGAAFLERFLGRGKPGAGPADPPREATLTETELDASGRPARVFVWDHRGMRTLEYELDYEATGRWKSVDAHRSTYTFTWRGNDLAGGVWPPKRLFPARDLLSGFSLPFTDALDDGDRPFRLPFSGTLTLVQSALADPETPHLRFTAQYDSRGRRTSESSQMFDHGRWRPLGGSRTTWKGDELVAFQMLDADGHASSPPTTLEWADGRIAAATVGGASGGAGERTTFSYDARGRLVAMSGGRKGPLTLEYHCDDP